MTCWRMVHTYRQAREEEAARVVAMAAEAVAKARADVWKQEDEEWRA